MGWDKKGVEAAYGSGFNSSSEAGKSLFIWRVFRRALAHTCPDVFVLHKQLWSKEPSLDLETL